MLSVMNSVSFSRHLVDLVFTCAIFSILILSFGFAVLFLYDHIVGFNDLDTCFLCGREYLPCSQLDPKLLKRLGNSKLSGILKKDSDGTPEEDDDEEEGEGGRLHGSPCGLCGAFIPY
jgi:hypothetical protein